MFPPLKAAAAALLSLTTPSLASTQIGAQSTSTVACNNSPLLCDRAYNNITHMGAHYSAFIRSESNGFSISGNQFYSATAALSAGLRLLQSQVHNSSGTLELCHTACGLLDAGSLESYLSPIKSWMDASPNEVVTLLIVNSDNQPASSFGSAFEASGISKYGYAPKSTEGPVSTWPTLQSLIDADTRLITFIASIAYDSNYPYLLSEFNYIFETAFDVVSLSGFNCSLQRPSSLSSSTSAISSGYMGLVNHFADTLLDFGITIPDVDNVTITNSPSTTTTGALGLNAQQCEIQWGGKPTFILVDFWNVGPSIETADNVNGIVATGRTSVSTDVLNSSHPSPVPSAIPSPSSSSSSSPTPTPSSKSENKGAVSRPGSMLLAVAVITVGTLALA
jgi:hypothetical protein